MSRKKVEWTLYSYDVWGNVEEGFEVNDVFYFTTIELQKEPKDLAILRALKECNFLAKKCKVKDLSIEDSDNTIYIVDNHTGEPIGELRRSKHVSS